MRGRYNRSCPGILIDVGALERHASGNLEDWLESDCGSSIDVWAVAISIGYSVVEFDFGCQ